jgi:moderate conductance mechanosensitive channel
MFLVAADACGAERRAWLCEWIEDWTDNRTAQDVARHVSPWLTILLIALAALVVNRIVHRVLKRAVRRWELGGRFAALRARAPLGMLEPASPVAAERRHQRAETIGAGLSSLATIVVWLVAVVWIMAVLGVEAATLLTSAGLIGVALAFGAQNLLRDVISGTFIIFEDQLGVGDVVDLGVAPTGTVEEVTLRTTRLRDVEGVVWHVPNGEIKRVGNKTQQWSRAVVDVPISTAADLDRARQVIKTTANEVAHDEAWRARILDAPEVWGVESFTLDTVTIRLVVKTAPSQQWSVAREMRTRIKQALDAAGIVSPATPAETDDPRRDVPE